MKKVFLAVALVAATFAFSSCAKEDPAKPVEVDLTQKGTIEGFIIMPESLKPSATTGNPFWASPKTAIIRATVEYSELTGNASAQGVYIIPQSDITYTFSTGKFTINAPVAPKGSIVTISVGDVIGTQTQPHLTEADKWVDVSGVFKTATPSIEQQVAPGELKIYGSLILDFTETDQNGSEVN